MNSFARRCASFYGALGTQLTCLERADGGDMKAAVLCGMLCLTAPPVLAADPATTFARKCSACHTFGHGILLGPDLKGVTDRHPRPWLTAWISSSEKLIRSGDRAAVDLFARFKSIRMPDQPLSPP